MHMGSNERGAYYDKTGKGQRYLSDAVVDAQKNWPTVCASEVRQGFQDRSRGMKGSQESLTTAVVKDAANWSTPRAQEDQSSVEAFNKRADAILARRKPTGGRQKPGLTQEVQMYGQAAPASSSSLGSRQGLWQTPKATNADCPVIHNPQRSDGGQPNLAAQMVLEQQRQALWLTPRANEPDSDPNFAARNADRGAHCHGTLSSQAKAEQWPTPEASQGGRQGGSFSQKSWMRQWATPNACDHKGATSPEACKKWEHRGQNLPEMVVAQWGTPAANDANKTPHCEVNSNQAGLAKSVGLELQRQWGTPTARDHKSGRGNEDRQYKELTPMVERTQAGKLNQNWVCCLMGVPMGWVDPMCPVSVIKNWPRFVIGWLRAQTAQIPSGFSAMELCLPPQSELSEFSLAS
jgi:hypothetical protein